MSKFDTSNLEHVVTPEGSWGWAGTTSAWSGTTTTLPSSGKLNRQCIHEFQKQNTRAFFWKPTNVIFWQLCWAAMPRRDVDWCDLELRWSGVLGPPIGPLCLLVLLPRALQSEKVDLGAGVHCLSQGCGPKTHGAASVLHVQGGDQCPGVGPLRSPYHSQGSSNQRPHWCCGTDSNFQPTRSLTILQDNLILETKVTRKPYMASAQAPCLAFWTQFFNKGVRDFVQCVHPTGKARIWIIEIHTIVRALLSVSKRE